MKNSRCILYVAVASVFLGVPASWADSAHHKMVTPDELKWADTPSVPPGVKVAVIEGSLNKALPITFRLKFPANYQLPTTNYQLPTANCRRTGTPELST